MRNNKNEETFSYPIRDLGSAMALAGRTHCQCGAILCNAKITMRSVPCPNLKKPNQPAYELVGIVVTCKKCKHVYFRSEQKRINLIHSD